MRLCFKWFYKNKKLTDDLVWERINISLKANNIRLARYLIRFLSNKNKPRLEFFLKFMQIQRIIFYQTN